MRTYHKCRWRNEFFLAKLINKKDTYICFKIRFAHNNLMVFAHSLL